MIEEYIEYLSVELSSTDAEQQLQAISNATDVVEHISQLVMKTHVQTNDKDQRYLVAERLAGLVKAPLRLARRNFHDSELSDEVRAYYAMILCQKTDQDVLDFLADAVVNSNLDALPSAITCLARLDPHLAQRAISERLKSISIDDMTLIEALLTTLVIDQIPIDIDLIERFRGKDLSWAVNELVNTILEGQR